jgi:hypothetical protein
MARAIVNTAADVLEIGVVLLRRNETCAQRTNSRMRT